MAHPLLDEIRYHPQWLRWKQEKPMVAISFFNGIVRDLPYQWKNFLIYKEFKRKEPRKEMKVANGLETAVMPEVYRRWMLFLCPPEVALKDFTVGFIKQRPELWLDGFKWRGA